MLTLGILHGIYALPEGASPIDIEQCLSFLDELFEEVVDDDGFVFENTPVYQSLWIVWASETARTLRYLFDLTQRADHFDQLSQLIRSNLRRFVVDSEPQSLYLRS